MLNKNLVAKYAFLGNYFIMSLLDDYSVKSIEELKVLLQNIEEELDEIDIERKLTLGGTGQHIGAAEVERIRHQLDKDRQKALDRQNLISEILKNKTK